MAARRSSSPEGAASSAVVSRRSCWPDGIERGCRESGAARSHSYDPCEMELSPRKREILRRVVEEYVATGQPVGSKVLVERSRMDVSPSTVRTELAELEGLGLLTHPHTSPPPLPTH